MAYLQLKGIEKFFASHRAIKGIDLSIEKGEFIVFVGPSGCGKSTLLRILNRMYDLYPGQRAEGEERQVVRNLERFFEVANYLTREDEVEHGNAVKARRKLLPEENLGHPAESDDAGDGHEKQVAHEAHPALATEAGQQRERVAQHHSQ